MKTMVFKGKSFRLKDSGPPVLAVGGELKNTVCLTKGDCAYLSEPMGDLEDYRNFTAFETAIEEGKRILAVEPEVIAYDLHPDYLSSKYALSFQQETRLRGVQHHHAHLAACLVENQAEGPAIGVTFDGTGYGLDGCIWGGEFLVGDGGAFQRWAHFAYLPMPSGSMAIKEPWRMAAQYLERVFGEEMASLPIGFVEKLPENWFLLKEATAKGINAPLTSSCGRLFDGVATLVLEKFGKVAFEAEVAIELERIAEPGERAHYPFALGDEVPIQIRWAPIWQGIVEDLKAGTGKGVVSARFHNTLAEIIQAVCLRISRETGIKEVALTGGVFQNRFLLARTAGKLKDAGLKLLLHHELPPNDSGIALGQAMIALQRE